MSVDKFGRRYYGRARTKETSAVSLEQMSDTFLKRDGTNTVIGTIDMTGNTLTNVSTPVANHDAVNKIYVDQNAGVSKSGDTMLGDLNMNNFRLTGLPSSVPQIGSEAVSWSQAVQLVRDSEKECASKVSKTGDVMTGNLILSADGDNDRMLGCIDLNLQRTFSFPLGTNSNQLYFTFGRNPVVMDTDYGFLIKTRETDICHFGSSYAPPEIIFYQDVRMNSNRITNLSEPRLPHEVANKLYVDNTPRKILQGYIPTLASSLGSNPNNNFGFAVTASSYFNDLYLPTFAFNNIYSNRLGTDGEWVTKGETRNFWLQINCPDLVRLWRIALRGRDTNEERIYKWRLETSTDGELFTTLFEPPNPTYLGNEVRFFPIETTNKFHIFRLFCLEAEPTNPGLSFMQLYVYSD